MTEQGLDRADIVIGLQKVGCEGVTEGMGGHALGDAGFPYRFIQFLLNLRFMYVVSPEFP